MLVHIHWQHRETNMSTAKHSVIRLPGVVAKTGLSRSSIYAAITRNEFPASISLGARSVGWLAADIDGWIESRIQARRARG
jgi:prophage regulatory protein